MIDQMGDLAPVILLIIVCLAILYLLALMLWIEDEIKKERFCRCEMEEQAQALIKALNQEWKLKQTGEDDEQITRCW